MRLLLTNDDGVHAPGLRALEEAAAALGELFVVAPSDAFSGCAHRVTTDGPVRVRQLGPNRFAVDGTPADCVRLALHGLVPAPGRVLSGVNAGGNLGADVYHSGTVAAVREAALHGVAGVALSQYRKRSLDFDWARAAVWSARVLADLLARPAAPGVFWNVNLPHLNGDLPAPETVECPLDPGPLPLSFRRDGDAFHYSGDYHGRRRVAGADVDVCFGGRIAVTRLTLG
jgi:5'-nucleotidase